MKSTNVDTFDVLCKNNVKRIDYILKKSAIESKNNVLALESILWRNANAQTIEYMAKIVCQWYSYEQHPKALTITYNSTATYFSSNELQWNGMETQNHDVIDILPHACIESLFLCSPIWREKKTLCLWFLLNDCRLFIVSVLSEIRKALNFYFFSFPSTRNRFTIGLYFHFMVSHVFMAKFIHNAEMISTFWLRYFAFAWC